jgi:hypothetical protein
MRSDEAPRQRIMRNLETAIERLNEDFERVEFWAAAMDAWLKPVPAYETTETDFLLPPKG